MDERKKDLLRSAGFGDEVKCVEMGSCPMCKKPINMKDFQDELSKKEFQISGMCQFCQDEIFR